MSPKPLHEQVTQLETMNPQSVIDAALIRTQVPGELGRIGAGGFTSNRV